jgi:hypothetical protein
MVGVRVFEAAFSKLVAVQRSIEKSHYRRHALPPRSTVVSGRPWCRKPLKKRNSWTKNTKILGRPWIGHKMTDKAPAPAPSPGAGRQRHYRARGRTCRGGEGLAGEGQARAVGAARGSAARRPQRDARSARLPRAGLPSARWRGAITARSWMRCRAGRLSASEGTGDLLPAITGRVQGCRGGPPCPPRPRLHAHERSHAWGMDKVSRLMKASRLMMPLASHLSMHASASASCMHVLTLRLQLMESEWREGEWRATNAGPCTDY